MAQRNTVYPLGDRTSGRGYLVRPTSVPGPWFVATYTFEKERPCRGRAGVGMSEGDAHAFAARMSGRPVNE